MSESDKLFASDQVSLCAYPLLLQLMAHSVQYNLTKESISSLVKDNKINNRWRQENGRNN